MMSSDISANQPSLSPDCTQRHDDSDAVTTGVFSTVSCDMVFSRLPIVVRVTDDSADVASLEHVLIALVDLLQLVLPGDHVVEVQLAGLVHRQQLRDVEVGVATSEDGAL